MARTRDAIPEFMSHLKRFRAERGWTLKQLSERAGLHWVTVARLESGARSPSFRAACDLADALGVSLDALRAGYRREAGAKKNRPRESQ